MKLQNLIHIPILIICFGLLPNARAVSPPPDGGYPGGNTAEGQNALLSRTTGGFNTAVGWFSLESLTTGSFNTGVGAGTLVLNTGDENTATGVGALLLNTTGGQNTANGALALFNNTEGGANTANGVQALFTNTTGDANTANGFFALLNNTTGQSNTAVGVDAAVSNTEGNSNTGIGFEVLDNNDTGSDNTAIGALALSQNSAGSDNIAVGVSAGDQITTASHVICIGASGANVDNGCYIGHIFGGTVPGGATVIIDNNGHLGTIISSQRFKDQIKPMDKASEAIFALKPVTFRYQQQIDPKGISQFGLVAEEVEKVNPDLVVRDKEEKPYSVRYEQVNAMLLNEFLKEHRKVEQQQATITELKSTVTKQEATIAQQRKDFEATIIDMKKGMETLAARSKEQDAKIQKVTDQIEMSRPAPQMVLNNP
jgi:Chaperone of endosialidase